MVSKWRKKEIEEAYLPDYSPEFILVPPTTYFAIDGKGHPDEVFGEYKKAVRVIKHIAYVSRRKRMPHFVDGAAFSQAPDGFLHWVYLQPTEAFWWKKDASTIDYSNKSDFSWIAVIRDPRITQEEDIKKAIKYANNKRGVNCTSAHYFRIDEGLCAQIIHVGDPNDMTETLQKLDDFIAENGFELDINEQRQHHEIYYTNDIEIPRDYWVTIIRRPIKKSEEI